MTTAVAVALYNGAQFLQEQLDSLKNQSVQPDQVILCDDGSSDNTVEIVEKYIAENCLGDRWKLYRNEKNLGYARNFYHAISLCQTDLVFLCDQDDVWVPEKIEKMMRVMEEHPHIDLLSCKYGKIDGEGKRLYGFLEREPKETGALIAVDVATVLRAYHWPGMVMCLRSSFFAAIAEAICTEPMAHDMVLALCAADHHAFYEYDYLGAFHRRHGNNTANEEHRISKLLNRERKLRDMQVYNTLLTQISDSRIPVCAATLQQVRSRLELAQERESAVRERRLLKLWKVYGSDRQKMLRWASFACDMWLICVARK